MRRNRIIGWIALAFALLFPASAHAMEPYDTFFTNHTSTGEYTSYMQHVYATGETISGVGEAALDRPSDLFIASDDSVYVADTGHNRIVQLDDRGKWVREIGTEEGPGRLREPEGVFVAPDGTVYVADTGNQRVAVYGADGTFRKEYKKPDSRYLPKDYYFVPIKVIVDARNVLYVVSKGSYQGLVRIGKHDAFTGFFGGNKASSTLLDRIKKRIFTKEQMAKEAKNRPPEVTNATIGEEGFIYTTTAGVTSNQVKLLDAGGGDRLSGKEGVSFNDSNQIVDVGVDDEQFFYVLDQRPFGRDSKGDGMISIHSPDGTELFRFGQIQTVPEQRGILSYPVGIDVNSRDELWVLDRNLNLIQVYDRTEFGETFLRAAGDYFVGDYEKSKADWEKVLAENELITLTYGGLGEIALKEGRIEDAMADFRVTYDAERYSEAFWAYRMAWIEDNLVYALAGLIAAWLLYRYAIRRLAGRAYRGMPDFMKRMADDLKESLSIMIHPYEGFYRLKGRKVSLWSLAVIVALALAAKLANVYWTGFIFHPVNLKAVVWWQGPLTFLVPFATWVVANYLVSTVKDGEGRFRDVLQGSVYALAPYIVFSVPILLLSNVLVLEERVLISSLTTVMWLWIVTLFIVKAQVIHNFEFMENIRNSAITVVTIGIIWAFAAVGAGLTFNLSDFFYQLYKEVVFLG